MMKAKVVEIEWVDSCGVPSVWEMTSDIGPLTPAQCVSVGYLLKSKKKYVTICQSLSLSQTARRFTIPRGCIKKIRTIAKG